MSLGHYYLEFADEVYFLVEVVGVVHLVNCYWCLVLLGDLLELLHFHDKLEEHLLVMRRIGWL